jgi:hypothetical protein
MRRCHGEVLAFFLWLTAVGLPQIAVGQAAPAAATFLVPTGHAYIGAYIELDPVAKGDISAFEKLVGRKHAGYLRYVGYGEPFPYRWAADVVAHGAMPQIAWEPNNGLSEVQDDTYLRGWAQAARHLGAPILLRYASEMNGDWMPYSGNPDEYIRKWRLVYRVMHETAPNVVVIWCPFGVPRSTIPLYYPGDEYVDWVGVNIYAVVYNNGDRKQPATDTQMDQLRFIYNLYADRKPIAVCEYAATHFCRASGQCTTDFAIKSLREFYEALPKLFPKVVFVSWFSVEAHADGLAHNDYAVTTDPAVLAAYKELVARDYFLTAPLPPAGGRPGGNPSLIAPPETPGTPALPPAPAVVPSHSLPLMGSAAPAARELVVTIRGSSPQAATGEVILGAAVGDGLTVGTVTFYLDDEVRCLTNITPYTWRWNTALYEPGEHVVRVVVAAPDGEEIAQKEVSVIVAPRE